MIIRKANPADIENLAVLFDQYRIFYHQTSDIPAAESFLRQRMANNESEIFIAEENETVLGFTQLYPIFSSVSMQRTWLLNDLYITEAARKKGIATALLDAAKDFATETEARWLLLQTDAGNFTAQHVYEKHGWQKISDMFYQLDV